MRSMLHENARLVPTARTLWEIEQKCASLNIESATNLYIDTRDRAREALKNGEERIQKVHDSASLHTYQSQVKALFLHAIGGMPSAGEAVHARVTQKADMGAFTLEKLLLCPRTGTYITANVYSPPHTNTRRPAVLIAVGHTDLGKADIEYQRLAQMLACAGFISLVFDPLGEGERFEHYEAGIDLQPIQGCSGEHDLLDWKAKLTDASLAKYFLQDGLTALDYLASRADVDASRIALTGHSGGGTQTCMLMLAAGDRFAACAPCTYVTDSKAMLDYGIDADNEMLWPGSLLNGLDYVDILAGVAPKPVLILSAKHDFFPREGTLRTLTRARALWKAAGSDTLPEMESAEIQHAYSEYLALAVAKFFCRHLGAEEANLSSFHFTPLPKSALCVTAEGSLLKAYPHMRTVHNELVDALTACRARRRARTDDARVRWLKDAIHWDASESPAEPRVMDEGICGHYAYRLLAWRSAQGYFSAGALLRDMRMGDAKLPTVIALWPEGLTRICEHSNWIHRCTAAGWQVLVMDVAASGTLAPASLGRSPMHIGWGVLYKLNGYLIQLGDSLCALRTGQAVRAVEMARAYADVDPKNVRLYGEGEFSRYALFAAWIARAKVCANGNYQDYEEIVQERYHDQTNTPDWAFPGVLEYLDMNDVKEALVRDGLLLTTLTEKRGGEEIGQ